jgi:hypothetical protein
MTPACADRQLVLPDAPICFHHPLNKFMLEELFNLVKNAAGQNVPAELPGDQKEEVVAEATNTVASGLRNMVAGGGAQNIINMFSGQQSGRGGLLGNPLVSMMVGHFANKLMNKFGMGQSTANNVSTNLIPSVLENLINKTNDPNDNQFSLDNLLKSITGGKTAQMAQEQGSGGGGLSDILGKLTSGGQGNGGGLMDIVTQLAQGAQGEQQKNGGSLLNIIRGFTGK